MMVKLSIIILNYKTRGLLKMCLMGIEKYRPFFTYEIIVVDNNSQDGSAEMIKLEFPQVKLVVNSQNLGHPRGVNKGLEVAGGEYILILNPDIVFLDKALEKMVEFMDNHQKIGLAGPKLINPDKTTQLICRRFSDFFTPFYRRTFLGRTKKGEKYLTYYLMKDYDHKNDRAVPWIQGSCMLVRHQALKKVGLLDPRFYLYLADEDWCRRFWRAGWQVYYLAQIKVVHYYHRESAQEHFIFSFFNPVSRSHIIDWLRYLFKYRQTSPEEAAGFYI